MATLTIRKLPEDVHRRLRLRAARRGHSMEAEAREILALAIQSEVDAPLEPGALADWLDAVLGDRKPTGVVDDFIRERREEAATESLGRRRSTPPSRVHAPPVDGGPTTAQSAFAKSASSVSTDTPSTTASA